MKIAHITATFPPYWSGTGTVCYFNARELAKLGHEVHVFTASFPDSSSIEFRDGFTIHRLKTLLRIGNAPLLPGLLGINGFDLIHLHYPFIFGAELVWMMSSLRHIPLVLTHHNDLIGDGIRRYLFNAYFSISSWLISHHVSKFIVVSEDYAKHCRLTSLYRKRWDDVLEVPNGIDTDFFRPGLDRNQVRNKHHIAEGDKVILFVGALDRAHHFKGVGILLDAFSQLSNRSAVLMLVGDGDQKNKWITKTNELGLSDRVYFIGAVPHERLPNYYAAADMVVLPSTPPESFGMVLIEAMACGRPVIASDIPGVRLVVENGQDGYLVNPRDTNDLVEKISILLNDPLIRKQFGTNGRSKTEKKYSLSKVTSDLENVYFSI